jgi:hypothetical protein
MFRSTSHMSTNIYQKKIIPAFFIVCDNLYQELGREWPSFMTIGYNLQKNVIISGCFVFTTIEEMQ